MIRFISTSDTDLLALAAAVERLGPGFPEVRGANPLDLGDHATSLPPFLAGGRVVVCRLLGGRRGWEEGFDLLRELCRKGGLALLAFSGEAEPDVQLSALSLAPAGALAQAGAYLRHGDLFNMEQLLRFLADTFLLEGYGFEGPRLLPDFGFYLPAKGDVPVEEAFGRCLADRPTVALCFYRAHRLAGNTAFVDCLFGAIEEAGANCVALWSYTLRSHSHSSAAEALALLRGRVDCLVATVQAAGSASGRGEFEEWLAPALEGLGVPLIQGICVTRPREEWLASCAGLEPFDAATQVAIPEFEGRIVGGVVSFKERRAEGSPIGAPLACYVPDQERCAALAALALRHARLRRLDAGQRRLGVVLTNFPNNEGRLGMAVGLDTPASAYNLLRALKEEGMEVELPFADGQGLIKGLIARFAHAPDLAGSLADLPGYAVSAYRRRYEKLPAPLREAIESRFGPPPGDFGVAGERFVIGAWVLGNVALLLQPLRAYGEDPVALYHDPTVPPSHHYLATYWWLEETFGADALVHLGKHGTLEWLPGKTVALSAACAPAAALGPLPLIYPFLVNDPGEGIQAKRRAHAVIVDHLLPVQTEAQTYGALAELEELLDEYARLELLDPNKLPSLAARIWAKVQEAKLHRDLGLAAMPKRAEELLERLDAYLCELKEMQVGEGLHVLGQPPTGERLLSLVEAIMRQPGGGRVGLRAALAAAYGFNEEKLLAARGAPLSALGITVPKRLEGEQKPLRRSSDLLAALSGEVKRLLGALAARRFAVDDLGAFCKREVGLTSPDLERALAFVRDEVVPRLAGCGEELAAVGRALRGVHIKGGPAGSPTRGRLDVLPTGRNFYSLDPRAMPSELACEHGRRLAEALLGRHRREHGQLPRMVGLVLWGSAAMRTQGEDFAQALALLGVEPAFAPGSRRVQGVRVVPLAELGRPRIDVAVRVSGFFRDAFSHLLHLLDEAVRTVAALPEDPADNFVRAHVGEDGGLDGEGSFREATMRVFSSKPGTYGAGLGELLETADWRAGADLADAYERYGSYAYGLGLEGQPARARLAACHRRIEAAVQNRDNEEHDILNAGDYLQFHGGMVAAVREARGCAPAAYIGDASRPGAPQVRTVEEEVRRVVRARVLNPRWIGAMVRHGYKGAAELAATVDYLFGYDATAGAAEGWMYGEVANRYLLDPALARFFDEANPWAARGIAQRLLEAHARGLWPDAPPQLLEAVEARLLALEGEAERIGGEGR